MINHGLHDAGYGYWGFSPANVPEGGYDAYGVDALGMNPDGYYSNNDKTLVDHGFEGCPGRDPKPDPPPAAYTNGVVSPHAAFLALRWAPQQTIDDVTRLERDFHIYTKWGFLDSVNVDSGVVSDSYLALDQGMIMGAIGNALTGDMLSRLFVTDGVERALRPPLAVEEFNASPRGCTIEGTAGDDHLTGTRGDDVICGEGGDDTISGGGGDDVVFGDAGDDTISGGRGDDVLTGGGGRDHYEGGAGDNRCPDLTGGDTSNACQAS